MEAAQRFLLLWLDAAQTWCFEDIILGSQLYHSDGYGFFLAEVNVTSPLSDFSKAEWVGFVPSLSAQAVTSALHVSFRFVFGTSRM